MRCYILPIECRDEIFIRFSSFCILLIGNIWQNGDVKEKSHDIAWRSTAKDFRISWDDIARESGLDSSEVSYIDEFQKLHNMLS